MLDLGSTYLIVRDIQKSIVFYEALLEMKASVKRFDRWAQFNFNGKCIALLNFNFDKKLINQGDNLEKHFSREYIEYFKNKQIRYGNNVVLNFYIDNLDKEYARIKSLNIGKMTEIMYLNISSPYYHFLLEDPDGNTIEVTGNRKPDV